MTLLERVLKPTVHPSAEHRSFDGLVLPTRRRVHPSASKRVTLVRIEIDEVSAQ